MQSQSYEEWSEYIDLCTKAQLADVKYINKQRRNREILSDRKKGLTQKEVGDKHGLSRNRISELENVGFSVGPAKNRHSKPPRPKFDECRFRIRPTTSHEDAANRLLDKLGEDYCYKLANTLFTLIGKSDDSCSQ